MRYFWIWTIVLSLLAGASAGWVAANWSVSPRFSEFEQQVRDRLDRFNGSSVTTTTETRVEIVPVERQPSMPLYPSAFLSRRQSPVMVLIKRPSGKTIDSEAFVEEHRLGNAVSVTVDGWLLTTADAVNGVRVSDISVVSESRVYAVERGVLDAATGVAYLKTNARDLPVTAFARSEGVAPGMAVWLEPRAGQLYPQTVLASGARASFDPSPSDHALRRFLVSGGPRELWNGAGVWDAAGQLVGLVEGVSGGDLSVIPASHIAPALESLLGTGEIRHASLGVAIQEIGPLLANAESRLPLYGAIVRGDRAHGVIAVDPKGPSHGLLQDGDVIERIERDILDGTEDLGERLLSYRPGAEVILRGHRKADLLEVTVRLGSEVTSAILK